MKFLLTFLFSVMLFGIVNAQNKEETLEWLNNHKEYIETINVNTTKFKVKMTDAFISTEFKRGGEKQLVVIYWSDIREVLLYKFNGGRGYVTISTKDYTEGPTITLHFSGYSTEMRDNLTLMANMSGTDVRIPTIDMQDK